MDRLENILGLTNFIIKSIETQIFVFECALFNNGLLERLLDKSIQYTFIEDSDPILHRTYYINKMVKTATTPFIAVWDADIIISPLQVKIASEWLQSGEADIVYPYDRFALDTTSIIRRLFLENLSIIILEQNFMKMKEINAPNPVGGAFFANRMKYINSGLENEDFYGWGMEDGERFFRWKKLGYKIKRVPGPLYHLSHNRGINSVYQNADQGLFKRKETIKISRIWELSMLSDS